MIECEGCGAQIPYEGSKHEGSSICILRAEQHKIAERGLIPVSPPAPTCTGHTNRAGTIAVCKILGLDYTLVKSQRAKPWVCVTPDVERTLRAVNDVAHSAMLVIPEAARRLAPRRELLTEFDAMKRLGAEDDVLFDLLALGGLLGEKAQFEARCHQRNPNRSDLSIRRAWEKFRRRRLIHARNLKSKR